MLIRSDRPSFPTSMSRDGAIYLVLDLLTAAHIRRSLAASVWTESVSRRPSAALGHIQDCHYASGRVEPVIDVRLGAFPEILADVAPETVALVVADPPWNGLDAWAAIGRFSARVLKPNGILLAYIGNRWCFEAMDLLSANLTRVRLAFLPAPPESPWDRR